MIEECPKCIPTTCSVDDDYGLYQLEDILPPPEPAVIFNQPVYFVHECPEGETLIFTGTLPGWITLDSGNSRLVGAAGTYQAATLAQANALAQNALNAFGNAAVLAADLNCESASDICADGLGDLVNNIYGIDGYVDGVFANPNGPTGEPLWDGTFPLSMAETPSLTGWASSEPGMLTMDGDNGFCINVLTYTCEGDVVTWVIRINLGGGFGPALWRGEKVGGATPEGIYTRVSGADPTPATVTIELLPGTTTPIVGLATCET